MAKSAKELVKASAVATKQRNDAAAKLEQLHTEMLLEFDNANNDRLCELGLSIANGAWKTTGNAQPPTAKMVSAALVLFARTSNMLSPLHGETPDQYAQRVADWINNRWRERGFQ